MTDGRFQVNPKRARRGKKERLHHRLALRRQTPDIAAGRLARDVSLANRVRSGRKQP